MLGPDALIVSTRYLKGNNGPVEMTAVVPEPDLYSMDSVSSHRKPIQKEQSTEEPWMRHIDPIREEMIALRRMIKELSRVADEAILPGFNDLRALIMETSGDQESGRILGPLYRELTEKGLMSEVARDMIRKIETELGIKELYRGEMLSIARGLIRKMIEQKIEVSGPLIPTEQDRVFAFVGPSGVGKTTTMAKIASRLVLNEGLDIVIITTDCYRVGSVDQTRRYAELIGVPFVVADKPSTMTAALRTYSRADALFIDTPGLAFEDTKTREHLKSLLDSAGEHVDIHLLMSAESSPAQMKMIDSRFKGLSPNRLIVTKVDETTQLGGMYNAQVITGLPVTYLTCGQRVPEDLETAMPRHIADLLLGSGE